MWLRSSEQRSPIIKWKLKRVKGAATALFALEQAQGENNSGRTEELILRSLFAAYATAFTAGSNFQ